ncbi:MAG TPA: integrase arm-type DNA-binding domain-containing protein, partial [Steroidobacteraceae bacterium]|nr:integrase arm-type DNA-binding domain-containing protein [Steroidobacteraceae bacterium]
MPKLTDTKIRNAKPRAKPFKLYDADGLFLIVTPVGGRWWRQRYRWQGKEQMLSLGTYPEIDLATARQRRDDARKLLARNTNPSTARQEEKAAQLAAADRSYETISLEWLEHAAKFKGWTADHIERVKRRQEVHFHPWLGRKNVADVTDDEVLACVMRISDKGLLDTAYRARAELDAIFRYAKKRKMVKHNPVADLRGADVLPKHKVKHHAAVTDPAQFGALLKALDTYPGGFTVRCALQFQALVFVRPGELRLARWEEFDLENAEWRIPAERMKMREHHVVPLSRQALSVLRALYPLTGPDGFVFPQVRNASRPISNNTLNAALRTLGYTKAQASAHGFRSTASTLLNESGEWRPDAIERQLAHG